MGPAQVMRCMHCDLASTQPVVVNEGQHVACGPHFVILFASIEGRYGVCGPRSVISITSIVVTEGQSVHGVKFLGVRTTATMEFGFRNYHLAKR